MKMPRDVFKERVFLSLRGRGKIKANGGSIHSGPPRVSKGLLLDHQQSRTWEEDKDQSQGWSAGKVTTKRVCPEKASAAAALAVRSFSHTSCMQPRYILHAQRVHTTHAAAVKRSWPAKAELLPRSS